MNKYNSFLVEGFYLKFWNFISFLNKIKVEINNELRKDKEEIFCWSIIDKKGIR
jgi:hypothetical protein